MRQIVRMAIAMLIVNGAHGVSEEPNGKASDKLPLSRDPVTGPTLPSVRRLPTSVEWLGRAGERTAGLRPPAR